MKTTSISAITNVAPRNPSTKQPPNKDNSTSAGKPKSTVRARDPLTNITNNNTRKSDGGTKKNISKSSKKASKGSSKRPSTVLNDSSTTSETGGTTGVGAGAGVGVGVAVATVAPKTKGKDTRKKRKSDPMMIDEEEGQSQVTGNLKSPASIQWDDIDQHDTDDPQAVTEYVNPIYEYLMEKEKDSVDANYMSNQVDVNEKMRAILVDWLVEVHRMFKLLPETLFLAVGIIDRFLSLSSVAREKLQLVGVTSMLIASKYEEIYAPECNDFVYISDSAYTKQQILKMEQTVLNTLNFNLTHPSPLHFLRRYSKAAGSDYTLHTLCKYLIELMLVDVKLLKFPPSLIAASSVYLARAMTHKTPLWTATLEHYSSYPEGVVNECALEMNELLKKSQKSSLKAIRKKYSLPKFGQVAEIPVVEL